MLKDINSRQQEYLARAKMLTQEIIAEWTPANKFNGGNVLPLVLGVLIIQHDELFKGGAIQAGVSQTELKKLLSIPQESADAWATAVSPNYRPIDAAFALLATPQLFTDGTFDKPLFDRTLPSATQLVKAGAVSPDRASTSNTVSVAGQSKPETKEVDLSGPWIIDGERLELKLNTEMSTVRKVYCAGDRMTQLKCLWVVDADTLRYEVSNQGFGLLNCSAPYKPDAPEMNGPCVFGNRPTPKGFTARRVPK